MDLKALLSKEMTEHQAVASASLDACGDAGDVVLVSTMTNDSELDPAGKTVIAQAGLECFPRGVAQTGENYRGGSTITARGLRSDHEYEFVVWRPGPAMEVKTESLTMSPLVDTLVARWYDNSAGWQTVPSLQYVGRYDVTIYDVTVDPTKQNPLAKSYFYVLENLDVTPCPDAVVYGSAGPITVLLETTDTFPIMGSMGTVPKPGEVFDVLVSVSTDTFAASGVAWLKFVDDSFATSDPNEGGSSTVFSLVTFPPLTGYFDVDAVQVDFPHPTPETSPAMVNGEFIVGGHPYFYVFASGDTISIDVNAPDALVQGESEACATTLDSSLTYSASPPAVSGHTIHLDFHDGNGMDNI